MSRYTGPKARLCRREGINIFGSDKYQKILQNRPGMPGMHGVSMRRKNSQYGTQLREKQKARFAFGVTERQMSNYFKEAASVSGDTGEFMMILMERRLDNIVYQAGYAATRTQARQFVNHGHVLVNGIKNNVPSTRVKDGDKITFSDKFKKNSALKDSRGDKYRAPQWLSVNKKDMEITVERAPKKEELDSMIDTQLIVEFYSR